MMIVPIIIMLGCFGALAFLQMPATKSKRQPKDMGNLVSAQEFTNVRDIVEHVLYTKDNYCISYIRLQPPMSSLWSRKEKRMRTNTIVAEVSKDREPWMLTAVSRPMDISSLINQYQKLRDETSNPLRKKLLKQEMQDLQKKVGGGEAIERQFYIKIWAPLKDGAEEDLKERARQIVGYYETIGITGQILKKPDIIKFCNLVHNPSYVNTENTAVSPTFPLINDKEGA